MSRYFTRPAAKTPTRSEWWLDEPCRINPTVSEHVATDTGLLDAAGNTIWRAPNPMGFIWDWPTHNPSKGD